MSSTNVLACMSTSSSSVGECQRTCSGSCSSLALTWLATSVLNQRNGMLPSSMIVCSPL